MSEPQNERVAELLSEGLDLYGMGELSKAIACWDAVLTIEPGNALARDYLESAVLDGDPESEASGPAPDAFEQTARLISAAAWEEAFGQLQRETSARPANLELQARLELVRSRLLCCYRQRIPASATPVMNDVPPKAAALDLSAEAGFLLSMIDGATSVEDLVSVSGLDVFQVYRLLEGLVDAGVVEISA